MTEGTGWELIVVGDAELEALARLPDYRRTRVGSLERWQGGACYILIGRTEAAELQRRSEQLHAETEALLARHTGHERNE